MMVYYNFSLLVEERLYVISAITAFSFVMAIGVRYVINRSQQEQSSLSDDSKQSAILYFNDKNCSGTNIRARQSRLLRKQFGTIEEDDLKLYEENIVASEDATVFNVVDDYAIARANIRSKQVMSDLDRTEVVTVFDETMGSTATLNDAEKENATITQQARVEQQSTVVVVSPPSTPETTVKAKKRQQKPQYERLQEHRRQQSLLAAESRLVQQKQQCVAHVRPLFHFWSWYDSETSLFRQYTLVRTDGISDDNTTIVPYHPSSRRNDTILIQLRITNDLNIPIAVHWLDHIGKHKPKGVIAPNGGTWQQSTFADHPWIFTTIPKAAGDDDDNIKERVLLHYIPHQVIPTTMDAPTIDDEMGFAANSKIIERGVHRFHIVPLSESKAKAVYNCTVHDPILPYPSSHHILTARKAAEYALQHCVRMRYDQWTTLQKYIRNIIDHPFDVQYRYVRIANPTFSNAIWNTPAKGVLLAYNFIEQIDIGYVYFNGDINTKDKGEEEEREPNQLSVQTIQELQLLLHMIKVSEHKATTENMNRV